MLNIDPTLPLIAVNGTTVRKVSADWQDALRLITGLHTDSPGAGVRTLVKTAAEMMGASDQAMTLGDAAIEALLNSKAAQDCDGAAKLKRWRLASKFANSAPFDLDIGDASFVQDALADFWKAGIYGPAHDALNQTGAHAPKVLTSESAPDSEQTSKPSAREIYDARMAAKLLDRPGRRHRRPPAQAASIDGTSLPDTSGLGADPEPLTTPDDAAA